MRLTCIVHSSHKVVLVSIQLVSYLASNLVLAFSQIDIFQLRRLIQGSNLLHVIICYMTNVNERFLS